MTKQQQRQGFDFNSLSAGPSEANRTRMAWQIANLGLLRRGLHLFLLRAYDGLGRLLGIDQPGESLVRSEDRFRLMVESSYVSVIHVDSTGRVRWISPSLELMLGWRPAEWIGQQVSGYVVPEDIDRLTANIGIILTTAQPLTERYRAIAKDGSIHWTETYASVLLDANGLIDGVVATFRTIDYEMDAEKRLGDNRERQEKLLLASLKAAAVAHELKQPLTVLSLKARQLARECLSTRDLKRSDFSIDSVCILSQEVENQVQIMVGTVKAMGSMLGSMQLHKDAINLSKVARDVITFCRPRIEAAAIQLMCIGIEGVEIVRGNADLLFIAIRNVVDNAIDELAVGPSLRKVVSIMLEESSNGIDLRVADSGRGFPLDQAISPYKPSTKQDGWGIGLINVHNIVKNHAVHLELGTSSFGGAEVLLRLPPPEGFQLTTEQPQ